MPHIRITNFSGIVPRLGDRGLPETAAQFALNAKLFSGELRPWNWPKFLSTLSTNSPETVYRYKYHDEDKFLAFSTYTNVVDAPLINDSFGRLYWTNANGAFITTLDDISEGTPPARLGVPVPEGDFEVSSSAGDDELAETRSYIAILVTKYGEEGAPRVPVIASGNADGNWTITGLDNLTYDATTYPNVEKLRLYRTITSSTGVDYRQVEEFPIGAFPAVYDDIHPATSIASASVLQSLTWAPPPANLQGLVAMANGVLAGFVGRTLYLSEPYFPHAWPEEYQLAVEDDIVALGTFGNVVIIATTGRPVAAIGSHPAATSLSKYESVLPCLSRRGLVSTADGVIYPSTDGLVLVSNAGTSIITRAWVTKDEWVPRFRPDQLRASVYQNRYIAMSDTSNGLTIGFDDPATAFTEIQFPNVSAMSLDVLTGQTLMAVGSDVFEWDNDPQRLVSYTWKSKPYLVPKPTNFGALQLRGDFPPPIDLSNLPAPLPAVSAFDWQINERSVANVPELTDFYMSETFVDGTLGNQPYILAFDHDAQDVVLVQDFSGILTEVQSGQGFDISADFSIAALGGRDGLFFNYRIEVFEYDPVDKSFSSLGAVPLDPRLSDEGNAFPTDVSVSFDGTYIAATVRGAADSTDPSFMVYKNTSGVFSILALPDPNPRFNTQGVEFSPDATYLIVSRESPPLVNEPISVYKRTGDVFVKVNGLNVRPAGTGTKSGTFSGDGSRFIVADHQDATPGVRVYAVVGDDFLQETIISVPSILVGNLWKSTAAISKDASMVACVSGPSPNVPLLFDGDDSWSPIAIPPHGLGAGWTVQQVAFLENERLVVTAYNGSTTQITLVVYSISPARVVTLEYTKLLTAPAGVHGNQPSFAGTAFLG